MDHKVYPKAFILPLIVSGEKDLEVRVADKKRKRIRVGDRIIFTSKESGRECPRKVVAIRSYTSFEKMLQVEDPARIMPKMSESEILAGIREIYPAQKESLGVRVFELAPVAS